MVRFVGQTAGGLTLLAVGTFVGQENWGYAPLFAAVTFLIMWAGATAYARAHPRPDPKHEELRADNKSLRNRVENLSEQVQVLINHLGVSGVIAQDLPLLETKIEAATETDTARSYTAVKTKGNWQIIHSWRPGPSQPFQWPGVIVAIRNTQREKERITRVEVTDPLGDTTHSSFVGTAPNQGQALSRLEPVNAAAADYPQMFKPNPKSLTNGRYEVRWFVSPDGVTQSELLTAAFSIQEGKLFP